MPLLPKISAIGITAASSVSIPDDKSIVAAEVSLPGRQDVIARCELEGPRKNGFTYNERIWIKYGVNVIITEVAAQKFAYEHVDQRIFRVPKIYDWFLEDSKTYIIMEKINGIIYQEYRKQHPDDYSEVFNAIVAAIRHLWTLPVPVQGPVGPFEQGIPNDRFFTDRCERTFESATDLQEWCNAKLIDRKRPERMDLASEPIVFCHLDITSTNIMVCEDKTLYIIDWEMSGIYPLVFEHYGLLHQGRLSLAAQLRSTLFTSTTSNLKAVAMVGLINGQGG